LTRSTLRQLLITPCLSDRVACLHMLPHLPLRSDLNPVAAVVVVTRTRTPDLPQAAPPMAPNPDLRCSLLRWLPGGPHTIPRLAWPMPFYAPGSGVLGLRPRILTQHATSSSPNQGSSSTFDTYTLMVRVEQCCSGSLADLGVVCQLRSLATFGFLANFFLNQ
jgi:hypothetical protein